MASGSSKSPYGALWARFARNTPIRDQLEDQPGSWLGLIDIGQRSTDDQLPPLRLVFLPPDLAVIPATRFRGVHRRKSSTSPGGASVLGASRTPLVESGNPVRVRD